MTEIIGVRFQTGGKKYYFNPNGTHVDVGQKVIIETAKGIEFGECVQSNTMVDEMELISTLRPMLRIATQEDFVQLRTNEERERKALSICQEKIAQHKLEMKLVDVKYSFDGSKVVFYFTADGRVDFRELVKDLASVFRTRIELRQIGVRDEAKMMGGLGICGRPFCCTQFLDDFQPVSIKMAKTQNISLNPTKISGSCGRLMCCLKYEQDAYEDLLRRAPKLESLVRTPDGIGTVNQVSLLREQSKVVLDEEPDTPRIYPNSELEIIRNGKGKRPAGFEKSEQGQERPAPRPAPQSQEESAEKPRRSRRRSNKNAEKEAEGMVPRPEKERREGAGEEAKPGKSEGRRRRHRSHRPRRSGGTASKAE